VKHGQEGGPIVVDQQKLHHMLSQFARTLVQHYAVGDVLYELTERVLAIVGIEGAGVSLADASGTMSFATAINEASTALEQAQEQFQRGPCIDAFRTREVTMVTDITTQGERWPEFTKAALGEGFHSMAAIPMRLDGSRLGALNLYRMAVHVWEHDEVEAASLFADMATSYVVNATELERTRESVAQLERALESRIVIEQAKGVIAAEHGVSVDKAFDMPRRHARNHHANLHEVSEAVVRLGLRL
jgi:GAF domain-containing protein